MRRPWTVIHFFVRSLMILILFTTVVLLFLGIEGCVAHNIIPVKSAEEAKGMKLLLGRILYYEDGEEVDYSKSPRCIIVKPAEKNEMRGVVLNEKGGYISLAVPEGQYVFKSFWKGGLPAAIDLPTLPIGVRQEDGVVNFGTIYIGYGTSTGQKVLNSIVLFTGGLVTWQQGVGHRADYDEIETVMQSKLGVLPSPIRREIVQFKQK